MNKSYDCTLAPTLREEQKRINRTMDRRELLSISNPNNKEDIIKLRVSHIVFNKEL